MSSSDRKWKRGHAFRAPYERTGSLRSLVEVRRRRCRAIEVEEKLGRDGVEVENEILVECLPNRNT